MTVEHTAQATEEQDEYLEPSASRLRPFLGATVTFILLIALWEFLVRQLQIPGWLLPSPSAIAVAMVEWRSEMTAHTLVTLYETLVGFALAIAISVPLAVAVVY